MIRFCFVFLNPGGLSNKVLDSDVVPLNNFEIFFLVIIGFPCRLDMPENNNFLNSPQCIFPFCITH